MARVGHTVSMHSPCYSYNTDLLLMAMCYDTTDLFQIIIHSYSELWFRVGGEEEEEEDVFKRV